MVRIPLEYQEVEYLESTGTQWINTEIPLNIIANEQTTWYLKFSPTNMESTRILCGSDANTKQVVLLSTGKIRHDWAIPMRTAFSKTLLVGGIYLISQTNGLFKLQTTEEDAETEQITKTTSSNSPFALFAKTTNSDGTTVEKSTIAFMKLYSFKAFDENSDICNLIPCYRKSDNEPGMYDTVSGTFYTNSGSGMFLIGNDVSWDTASLLERRRQILLNTPHIETVSSSMASFNTDISANLKECKVYFSPVQEGTGDPSPDNVRPITGWDGIEVSHNIGQDFYTYSVSAAGFGLTVTKINDNSFRLYSLTVKNRYPATKQLTNTLGLTIGKKYIINCDIVIDTLEDGGAYVFGFRNTSNTFQADSRVIVRQSGHYSFSFTYDSNTRQNYLSICETSGKSVLVDITVSNLKIHEVETITIPFNRTIYGGYVDLMRGEVVEEIGSVDLSTINFQQYSKSGHCWSRIAIPDMKLGNEFKSGELYCDSYKASDKKSILSNGENLGIWAYNAGQRVLILRNDAFIDGEGVYDISALRASLVGAMAYYPLATPNIYTFTPETIKSLKGINNIWSNANENIEVSYYSH